MITAHALTPEMAAINCMVNAAMTVINNERVQRVGRNSSSDDDTFFFQIDEDPQIYIGKRSNILADSSDTDGIPLIPRCCLHHQSQNIARRSK